MTLAKKFPFSLKPFLPIFLFFLNPVLGRASVYEQVAPAIVNIQALHLVKKRDFFDFFFPMDDFLTPRTRTEGLVVSVSGTCVDSEIVVTNGWAVMDAQKITCFTQDGREIDGTVVYEHEGLALVKLASQGAKMPFLELSPHSTDHSITAVGFSKKMGTFIKPVTLPKDRGHEGLLPLSSFIHGEYSGGALVQNGKLVGILDAMLGQKKHNSNSFAVPVSVVQAALKGYKEAKPLKPSEKEPEPIKGAVVLGGAHILSGYEVADITPALAKRFGLDEKTKGVIITRTPTHVSSSGLMTDFLGTSWQPGDMIRNVNGSKINTVEQLVQLLSPTDQTVFKVEIEGRGGRSTVEMSVGSPKRHKKNTQKPSLEGTI